MKRQRFLVPVFFTAAILAGGCGTREMSHDSQVNSDQRALPSRFTEAQVAAVYSDATEVRDGKVWPVSLAPDSVAFKFEDAPAPFKQEWGDFTAGGEMRAYLNMGFVTAPVLQNRLIRNFEAISTWTGVLNGEGKPVFSGAATVDANNEEIADQVDGIAAATGEIHKAKLVLDVSGFDINVYGDVNVSNSNGDIKLTFTNTADVKAPFVGTIIKRGGMRVVLNFWPYQKGWLSYGASVVKMEKMGDQFKPETAEALVSGFFDWVKNKTILAIR